MWWIRSCFKLIRIIYITSCDFKIIRIIYITSCDFKLIRIIYIASCDLGWWIIWEKLFTRFSTLARVCGYWIDIIWSAVKRFLKTIIFKFWSAVVWIVIQVWLTNKMFFRFFRVAKVSAESNKRKSKCHFKDIVTKTGPFNKCHKKTI